MGIAAQRFKALDKQTNVATADFLNSKTSDIFNSPNLVAKDITEDMRQFFENDLQVSKITTSQAATTVVRAGKDAMGAIKDLSKFSDKDIDNLITGMLGKMPAAAGMFSKLAPKCKTKGLSTGQIGKLYDLDINCGGKSRKGKKDGCNSSEYGNVLNKLTNGGYAATHTDFNAMITNLVGLSKLGYDMNLCGVFTSLSGGLNNNMLSRASGALLGHLGNSGNVLGVFDLAGSSAGLHTLLENPDGINGVFKNFTIPEETKQNGYGDLNDRLIASMELLDSKWNSSSYDSMPSSSFSDGYNDQVDEVLRAKQLGQLVDEDNLGSAVTDDESFIATAYSMNNNVGMDQFYG